MSDYTVQINWSGKDSLPDSSADKIISGADFQTEFDQIETDMATKADINGSGTEAFSALSLTLGGTAITATAAELNILDGVTATATEINLLDGITAIADEDDMTSNSATSLATQQSIKAYVDSQTTGTIAQVLQSSFDSTITSSTYMTVTGASVSITPSATSSKIYVMVESTGTQQAGCSNGDMNLKRGSTVLTNRALYGGSNSRGIMPFSLNDLDSPSTTSSTTYSLEWKQNNSGNLCGGYYEFGVKGTITVMEVLA